MAHSRSPAMHNAALAECGLIDWRYQLLPVPPSLLAEVIAALPALGFRGVNVTIPHKAGALAAATDPTPAARAIGAANTLLFASDGTIAADNTDAPALIAALPAPARGRTALVLGAGGSARAAVWALLDAGAAEVRVLNRTPERAGALARELGATAVSAPAPADLLINCTAVGLGGEVSPAALPGGEPRWTDFGCLVDLVYVAAGETPLIAAARSHGVPTVDGLELLVGQGALSFAQFTGRPAPRAVMARAVGLQPPAPPDP